MRRASLRLLSAALLFALPGVLDAQRITMPADAGHAASPFHRIFFGNGYRDVWTVPITVPVLDLDTFEGGLTAFQEGGNQSRTLRLRAANGKVYQFRSTKKFLPRAMPEDLQNTPAGDLIHDQSSAMHPTAHMLVSGLQTATGVLHSVPNLYVLPDNPRLGKFRKDFAGLMGQLEERPQDYDDERLNFAGAEKIQGADKLIENLEESMEGYLDAREYLRARLIDMLIGDTDRGADQWEFARFDEGEREVYRPIPRDRDYAFMNSNGLLIRLASFVYPKLVVYNEDFASLRAYMFMTREFDRAHLTALEWAEWEQVVKGIQNALTDRVIETSIMRMPPEHRQLTGPHFAASLKERRDGLLDYARRFYHVVNEEASVFASDENESAQIDRHPDGSVTVRIFREGDGGDVAGTKGSSDASDQHTPAFERRFVPGETSEIRVFLERGNDRAVVRGRVERTIDVRIVGGEGDDVLIDSTSAPGTETFTTFYDAHGKNTIMPGPHSRVSDKPYVTRQPVEPEGDDGERKKSDRLIQEERRGRYQDLMNADAGFVESKTSSEWIRDWGEKRGFMPAFGLEEGSGVIVGVGYDMTDFGFRRVPHETRMTLTGMVSPTTGRLGAEFLWDRRRENSPLGFGLITRAVQFESNRFFGWGNDSPSADDLGNSLVVRDEAFIHPMLRYDLGLHSYLSLGPIARYTNLRPEEGSVADTALADGSRTEYGANAEFVLTTIGTSTMPRSGFLIRSGFMAFESHANAQATVATFLSLGAPILALRVGGSKVFGTQYLPDAAFVGGFNSLRGYRYNRFAGDAAVFGGAELRIPITRAVIFSRGDLGILALADAGRVWFDGESEGGWHTGYGGGLWFHTLGQTISVQYAQGDDEGRFYFKVGAPF